MEINSIELYDWQQNATDETRKYQNIILSSPTGTGKTIVFLKWALEKSLPIIITSPIKALSNQRYLDLKNEGFDVGIETGDVKNKPKNWKILCCTQEIYTNTYCHLKNVTLIVDELHYIFENSDRSRSYVECLINSKAKNIFICSATLGKLSDLKNYVEFCSGRKFFVYENKERITELKYCKRIELKDIKNALVIAFSVKGCIRIISALMKYRDKKDSRKINEIASFFRISKKSPLIDYVKYGLAIYHGNMLPKEKLFIERLFTECLIDTVVGTDAMAYGVNFPIQKVVFCQLVKYNECAPISRNMFEQISGRAGRKGYYDVGSVFFNDEIEVESFGHVTGKIFSLLIKRQNESISIKINMSIKNILNGYSIDDEAEFVKKYSTENPNINFKKIETKKSIKYISEFNKQSLFYEELQEFIKQNYSDELSVKENLNIIYMVFKRLPMIPIFDDIDFKMIMKYRQFLHSFDEGVKREIPDLDKIDKMINDLDHTVLKLPDSV